MFKQTEYLHLFNEDLYRLGNSASPRISNVRSVDVRIVEINGIQYVLPNTGGISLMDQFGLSKTKMAGWVWRIKKDTLLPVGLKLVNDKEGHYSLAPSIKMKKSEYISLLERLVEHCERYLKV